MKFKQNQVVKILIIFTSIAIVSCGADDQVPGPDPSACMAMDDNVETGPYSCMDGETDQTPLPADVSYDGLETSSFN